MEIIAKPLGILISLSTLFVGVVNHAKNKLLTPSHTIITQTEITKQAKHAQS
jgi:hypothetical protein